MSEKEMTFPDRVTWMLKLANAILDEAGFNNCHIKVGDDIEHQLGTVWIGDAAITFVKTESLDD